MIALPAAALVVGTKDIGSVASLRVATLFVFAQQSLMPLIDHAHDDELRGTLGAVRCFSFPHFSSQLSNGLLLFLFPMVIGLLIWTH